MMSCPRREIVETGAGIVEKEALVPEVLDKNKKISNDPKHYMGDQLKREESQYYLVELKPEHLTTSVLPENLYFPRIINLKLCSEELSFLLYE